MSEQQNYGFGKFVPGFDFLQSLAKGASQAPAAMPNLSSWVAPTLNVEELDKRIGELKAVSFWLDQNAKALAATIQALELQKMTLATLKGMNFNMADIANALKLKPGDATPGARAGGDAAAGAGSVAGAAIVGHVAMGVGWLLWAFLVLVAAGLGAQIWFVLGWMRAVKREEGASS